MVKQFIVCAGEEILGQMGVGDHVDRLLGDGSLMMRNLAVTAITDDGLIVCGPWRFDRKTGAEIDEDLGWTAEDSGSFIVPAEDG